VDARVADDGEAAVTPGEEHKHAVARRGAGHAQPVEHTGRVTAWIRAATALHMHADFAGGGMFGLANGGHDPRAIRGGERRARK